MELAGMSEKELAAYVRTALATPSGKVLKELLRTQCYMRPQAAPAEWRSGEQVEFRYGRMTLFQMLEHYEQLTPTVAEDK